MSVYSILIVDDDVGFGSLVKRVLSDMGHNVEQISDPREIMDCYDKRTPDIIFLDIFMPDLDGIEVANWLIEKRFNGKLVFMTGRDPTFLAAARAAALHGEAHVVTLEKPARIDRIRELLKEQRGKP